jgi:hypothetical protein
MVNGAACGAPGGETLLPATYAAAWVTSSRLVATDAARSPWNEGPDEGRTNGADFGGP